MLLILGKGISKGSMLSHPMEVRAASVRVTTMAICAPTVIPAPEGDEDKSYVVPQGTPTSLRSALTQVLSLQPDVRAAYLTQAVNENGGLVNLVLVVNGEGASDILFDTLRRTMKDHLGEGQPFDVVHIEHAPKAVVYHLANRALPVYHKSFDGRRCLQTDSAALLTQADNDGSRGDGLVGALDSGNVYATLGR
jgi:hypothetical protein